MASAESWAGLKCTSLQQITAGILILCATSATPILGVRIARDPGLLVRVLLAVSHARDDCPCLLPCGQRSEARTSARGGASRSRSDIRRPPGTEGHWMPIAGSVPGSCVRVRRCSLPSAFHWTPTVPWIDVVGGGVDGRRMRRGAERRVLSNSWNTWVERLQRHGRQYRRND